MYTFQDSMPAKEPCRYFQHARSVGSVAGEQTESVFPEARGMGLVFSPLVGRLRYPRFPEIHRTGAPQRYKPYLRYHAKLPETTGFDNPGIFGLAGASVEVSK